MRPQRREITSEWEGLKGRIGGWYLNSPLRRLAEIFLLGDLRTRFLQQTSLLLRGDEIVLDAGAGSGYFSLPVAARLQNGKVICIDLSSQMLSLPEGAPRGENSYTRSKRDWEMPTDLTLKTPALI